jgi:hypothetical protein
MNDLARENSAIDAATSEPPELKRSPAADTAGRMRAIDLKWWGLLPLLFFLAQGFYYWRNGSLGNMLWMCNIGNLLLAIALLIGHREMIRATAIWTVPGLVIWILYVLVPAGFVISSAFAHVGGFIVGIVALRAVRVDRRAWLYAFIWYLVMQVVARLATSKDLNVNLVYRIQSGWESAFTSFWQFWLLMTLLVAFGLWAIGRVLQLVFPPAKLTDPGRRSANSG